MQGTKTNREDHFLAPNTRFFFNLIHKILILVEEASGLFLEDICITTKKKKNFWTKYVDLDQSQGMVSIRTNVLEQV